MNDSVRESVGEWAKTIHTLAHVPSVLFAVAVVRFAHWFKQNGWILAMLKVTTAVLASAISLWVVTS